ncbi:MAG: hypothetical protein ACRCXX_11575 [Cetobacterium sp.]|uniref:hypothetical protein n=1 Tax=Cetobacterium sp. TaxID=2071632 RepID=UPI003F3C1202
MAKKTYYADKVDNFLKVWEYYGNMNIMFLDQWNRKRVFAFDKEDGEFYEMNLNHISNYKLCVSDDDRALILHRIKVYKANKRGASNGWDF